MQRVGLAILASCGVLLALAGRAAAAPPSLTAVQATVDGYTLVGTGFVAGKTTLEVFEGAARVAADRIVSVTPGSIVVRGKPSGTVQHKVVVGGQPTAVVAFTHDVRGPKLTRVEPKASASGARATQSGPRALTLARLQVTGYRAEAQAARALTLGTLSATGYREEAPQARSLTLGTLSAEGYRE